MAKTQELTVREQAAIRLYIYEGEDLSPVYVYRLAHPGSLEDWDKLKDPAASASRWIRTAKVVEYMNEQRAILNDRKAKERMKMEADIAARLQASKETGKHTVDGFVDYSQPKAQLAKLNELINTASDPGEVLDAMKVLISKQAEIVPERKEKASRFYRPICCDQCPLYAMAGSVLRLRNAQHYNNCTPEAKAIIDEKLRTAGRVIIEEYVEQLLFKK